MGVTHAVPLGLATSALPHLLPIRSQVLIVGGEVVPVLRLDKDVIVRACLVISIIKAQRFCTESCGGGLGPHRNKSTLLLMA